MPVELASLEKIREGELLEPRRGDDRVQNLVGERAHEDRGRDQPPQTKGRCQRLARGAEIGDALGGQPLERARPVRRRTETRRRSRPRERSRRSARPSRARLPGGPGRARRRSGIGGPASRARRPGPPWPGRRHRCPPRRRGSGTGRSPVRATISRITACPGFSTPIVVPSQPPQSGADEDGRLGESSADERVLRIAGDSAHPPEVGEERRTQCRRAADVAVCELLVGRALQRRSIRLHPFLAREAGVVGQVRPQVVPCRLLERLARGRRRVADRTRDTGRSAPAQHEVALCPELGVGADHEPSRDPELGGERTGRRKRGFRLAAARRGSLPGALARAAQRASRPLRGPVGRAVRRPASTGPDNWHESGP